MGGKSFCHYISQSFFFLFVHLQPQIEFLKCHTFMLSGGHLFQSNCKVLEQMKVSTCLAQAGLINQRQLAGGRLRLSGRAVGRPWAPTAGWQGLCFSHAVGLRQLCRLSGLIGNDVLVLQAGWPRLAAVYKVQSGFSEIHVEFSPNPPVCQIVKSPSRTDGRTRKTNVCLAVFERVWKPSGSDFVPYQLGEWTFILRKSHCLSFQRHDGVKINSRVIIPQSEQRVCWLS